MTQHFIWPNNCCRPICILIAIIIHSSPVDTLQRDNTLQLIATHCNTLQHVATVVPLPRTRGPATVYCSVLQCVAVCCCVSQCCRPICILSVGYCSMLQCVAVCCSVLQCVAVCCSVLQCVAVCCSVLQCVAVLQCAAALFAFQVQDVSVCCSVLQCVAQC